MTGTGEETAWLWSVLRWLCHQLGPLCDLPTGLAFAIAVGTPIFAVLINHSVRLQRIRQLHEFGQNFKPGGSRGRPAGAGMDLRFDIRQSSSLEFAVSKYLVGLESFLVIRKDGARTSPWWQSPQYVEDNDFAELRRYLTDHAGENKGRVEFILRSIGFLKLQSNRLMLLRSVPLMVLVFFGFHLALSPATTELTGMRYIFGALPIASEEPKRTGPATAAVSPPGEVRLATVASGGTATVPAFGGEAVHSVARFGDGAALPVASSSEPARLTLEIAEFARTLVAVAFVSAFITSLATIVRAIVAFDLTPALPFRLGLHILGSVAATVMLWRVFGGAHSANGDSPFWLGIAWLIGAVPASSFQHIQAALLNWLPNVLPPWLGGVRRRSAATPGQPAPAYGGKRPPSLFDFIKQTDTRFARVSKSIPLDVIDGIDAFTKFRLEEALVYEVQNLAVANPIVLHVETPYGIYQLIDWVAQAQLCTVVGIEKYLTLRHINIRTVFDLERAVLSVKSTSAVRRIIGAILLMPTDSLRELSLAVDMRFNALSGKACACCEPAARVAGAPAREEASVVDGGRSEAPPDTAVPRVDPGKKIDTVVEDTKKDGKAAPPPEAAVEPQTAPTAPANVPDPPVAGATAACKTAQPCAARPASSDTMGAEAFLAWAAREIQPSERVRSLRSTAWAPRYDPNGPCGWNAMIRLALGYSRERWTDYSVRRLAPPRGAAGAGGATRRDEVTLASFEVRRDGRPEYVTMVESEETDATIKHMVRVIVDDLHVQRLRQIWESISRRLGDDASLLDDSEDVFMHR